MAFFRFFYIYNKKEGAVFLKIEPIKPIDIVKEKKYFNLDAFIDRYREIFPEAVESDVGMIFLDHALSSASSYALDHDSFYDERFIDALCEMLPRITRQDIYPFLRQTEFLKDRLHHIDFPKESDDYENSVPVKYPDETASKKESLSSGRTHRRRSEQKVFIVNAEMKSRAANTQRKNRKHSAKETHHVKEHDEPELEL